MGKNFWFKKNLVKKIRIKNFFCLKGRVNPRWRIYDPPPENSRVKIVMDCCQFGLVRSPSKFQTPRIILSGRIRVPVGWGGWVGGGVQSDNRVKPNRVKVRLWLSCG